MSKPALLLLGRPGCHLCQEFRDDLEDAFPGRVELHEACVDDRADWRERYGVVIPALLAPDGALICATRFDAAALARALPELRA